MSEKYVIKNCPAYDDMPNMYDEICGWCKYEHDLDLNKCLCENINDCVMKKIVEKCREDEKPIILDVHEEAKDGMIVGRMLFKKEILDMLEIEECE